MKYFKRISCIAIAMVLLLCAALPAMAQEPIKVIVGGERVRFDVEPQIINDRTMVPLRAIFENIGADVDWDDETKTVISTKRDTEIKLTIDDSVMYVNEKEVALDSPACIVDGRTLIPVRAVSEAFNLKVEWDESERTVRVRIPVSLVVESVDTKKIEYDDFGNKTYEEYIDGSSVKYVYDNDGTETRYYSDGSWSICLKDEYGNEVYYEDSDGWWRKFEYDENGNEVYFENSDGDWEKYIYDERGNMIYSEDSDGGWTKVSYDELGRAIYYENSYYGLCQKFTYEDNMIFIEDSITYGEHSYNSWRKTILDDNGNEIYFEDAGGSWEKTTYDEYGNEIYSESSYGTWEKSTYDENGNIICREDPVGVIEEYTYDENGNKIYFENIHGYWARYVVKEI